MGMPAPSQPPAMNLEEYRRWLSNAMANAEIVPKTWRLMKPRVRVPYNKETNDAAR